MVYHHTKRNQFHSRSKTGGLKVEPKKESPVLARVPFRSNSNADRSTADLMGREGSMLIMEMMVKSEREELEFQLQWAAKRKEFLVLSAQRKALRKFHLQELQTTPNKRGLMLRLRAA